MIHMNKDEKNTLDFYDKNAEIWNKINPNFNFWKEDFSKFRKILPKGKIIDVGCGAGKEALFFKEYFEFYQYIGIDISPEMIKEARRLAIGTIFLEMNMYKLNFLKNSFDGFWATESLLHIPKNGVFQKKIDIVLGQIRKIVKSDGIGFITIKEGEGEQIIYDKHGDSRFYVFYGEKEFIKVLEKNKFKVLKFERDLKDYKPLTGNPTIWLKYFVKVKK